MKGKLANILLIMACVVTACTDNKEEPVAPTPTPTPVVEPVVEEQVPIGFSASIEQPAITRTDPDPPTPVYGSGTLDNNDYIYNNDASVDIYDSNKGFGVFAVYTGNFTYRSNPSSTAERQIVMKNQQVKTTDSGSTWTYSPLRFWPGNTSNISFFAYAPYLADSEFAFPTNNDVGTETAANGGYSYLNLTNGTLKAPTIEWNHPNQTDLVYGVANADANDVNGIQIISAGDDYTDIRRPSDGTLHWKLKHALARARFTVTNYMQYDEQLTANNITLTDQGNGLVYEYSGDETFTDENNEEVPYQGYYVQLEGDTHLHKYTQIERRLIIKEVSFVNLNKTGELALMNKEANNDPEWKITATYTGTGDDVYKLAPLNPLIGENYDSFATVFSNILVREDQQLPLNAALKKSETLDVPNEELEHYVLLLPQKYDSEKPIIVTVKYQICTYVKLEHNFTYQDKPVHVPAADAASVFSKEYYLKRNEVFSISGTIRFDIEPAKTFNILISLGKLLNVSYELTDWDDNHEVVIPPFE